MSNNMNYQPEIQYNVESVLANVKERGGTVNNAFLIAEQKRLQGQRAQVVMNVAMMAMGKPQLCPLEDCRGLTEKELEILVGRAKKQHEYLLTEIRLLREAKGLK